MKFLFTIFLICFHGAVSQTATCNDSESKLAAITKFICNNTTSMDGLKGLDSFKISTVLRVYFKLTLSYMLLYRL